MALKLLTREKEGQKTPTRVMSKAQETAIAKAIGGWRTPNSGATMFGGKGDVHTQDGLFLVECKTKMTSSTSITLKKEWFEKNKQEMVFEGKEHEALVFNFGPNEPMHYIIDEYLFLDLLEYLRAQK